MNLLLILLALGINPTQVVTETGHVILRRQIDKVPMEFVIQNEKVTIPLIGREDNTLADLAEYEVPVTITGMLIEHQYRRYLIVDTIK